MCPSIVDFCGFIRDMRSLARSENLTGACTHGNTIHTWAKMMTNPDMKQSRIDWLGNKLKTSDESDTIYFTGCLPYYDVLHLPEAERLHIVNKAVYAPSLDLSPDVFEPEPDVIRICVSQVLLD